MFRQGAARLKARKAVADGIKKRQSQADRMVKGGGWVKAC